MADKPNKNLAARKVELIIRQLNSISTLPEVAAGLLSQAGSSRFSAAAASHIIEADPALSAKVLSLAQSQGITFRDGTASVAEALAKLDDNLIRQAVLSVKVFNAFENNKSPINDRVIFRRQMAMHSLAVACCASEIASFILPATDSQLAFTAGLLHDIGKLAIDEAMPKSFARIIAQAKEQNTPISLIEREHLGLDHAIVGKRLAEKWHLPEEITFAIWLHHNHADGLSANIDKARLAPIVRLADIIARNQGIGGTSSLQQDQDSHTISAELGISSQQITAITQGLADKVAEKTKILGLDIPGGQAAYCDIIHSTAAELAQSNTQLQSAGKSSARESAQTSFIEDFLEGINNCSVVADIAEIFATTLKDNCKTGPVYICLKEAGQSIADVVGLNDDLKTSRAVVEIEKGDAFEAMSKQSFAVRDDCQQFLEIFSQSGIDLKIDVSKAIAVPIGLAGTFQGVVLFENRIPADNESIGKLLHLPILTASQAIAQAFATQAQRRLSEELAVTLSRLNSAQDEIASSRTLKAVAEMAAGAGHELNNPLAVISGRAQLLCDSEDDPQKQQMLKQINERSEEIANIVSDLMAFAKPTAPDPQQHKLVSIIDSAVTRTTNKHELQKLEVSIDVDDNISVFVDASQISTALANMLSNSLESYKGENGPIEISAKQNASGKFITLTVSDRGCGMSVEALGKTFEPFFSEKKAGRKRGMGLAHSKRLIDINNGDISITSGLSRGTTVTIKLPTE